jgi:hypothetical protein
MLEFIDYENGMPVEPTLPKNDFGMNNVEELRKFVRNEIWLGHDLKVTFAAVINDFHGCRNKNRCWMCKRSVFVIRIFWVGKWLCK